MTESLPINNLGNPILLQVAEPVVDPSVSAIQELVAGMNLTMDEASGLGLAAPQVGKSLRLFLMESRPTRVFSNAPCIPRQTVINPEILEASDLKETGWESCLSIPSISARVPRSHAIRARWVTVQNSPVEMELTGLAARVFQHEFDHLNGKLIFDRVESTSSLFAPEEFEQALAVGSRGSRHSGEVQGIACSNVTRLSLDQD